MNRSLLRSVVWKEYRVLRSVWLSMLAIAVAMQLLVLVSFAFSQNSNPDLSELPAWLFGIALTMSAMYALGCTAALFSAEREEGTHEFLMLRAPSPRAMIAGKAGFGLLTVVGLVVFLWFAAWVLSGRQLPDPKLQRDLWGTMGLAILELFAWGTLFSLLLKNPLRAAILAVATSSIVVQLLPHVSNSLRAPYWFLDQYTDSFSARVVVLGLLVALDVWIAGRWFQRPWQWKHETVQVPRHDSVARDRVVGKSRSLNRATRLGRLVWQQWRHTAVTTAIVCGGMLLLVALIAVDQEYDLTALLPVAVVVSALIGACTFLTDKQERSFRFLVSHAASPSDVWLSRVGVGFMIMILATIFFSIVVAGLAGSGQPAFLVGHPLSRMQQLPYLISIPVLAYCAGQLCSLLFRGGLLAAFFGLFLAGLLAGWDFLMLVIAAPWWWSVAPLVVALLLATWLRMPAWLLERRGWRPWLPFALVLVVPTIAILVAVPFFRVYEIPLQSPGFSVAEFTKPLTAEEKETADMYRRAWELIEPIEKSQDSEEDEDQQEKLWHPPELSDVQIRWVERNSEAIELALQANARGPCVFDDLIHGPLYPTNLLHSYDLAQLLVTSARVLQSEGKLDEAFDRYLATLNFVNNLRRRGALPTWYAVYLIERMAYHYIATWAAAEGQTTERIHKAISEVQEIARNAPPFADTVKAEYVRLQRVLSTDVGSLASLNLGLHEDLHTERTLVFFHYLAPWELARSQRLANVVTAQALEEIEYTLRMHEEGTRPNRTALWDRYRHWRKSTPFVNQYTYHLEWMIPDIESVTVQRNAALVLMALAGWQLDHDSLPETLMVLVGTYFKQLPVDYYSGEPFEYRPEGFPSPIRFHDPDRPIPAEWPLIWSVGRGNCRIYINGTNREGIPQCRTETAAASIGSNKPVGYSPSGIAFPVPKLETKGEQ